MSNECKVGNETKGCQVDVRNGFGEQYPYECVAKDKNPTHTVFVCNAHNTWWHEVTRDSLMRFSVSLNFPELVERRNNEKTMCKV
jgi:hypothetical protein